MSSKFALFFLLLVSSTFPFELTAENCGLPTITENMPIDEELYSRQLFVYGKTAQKRLASSRILVHGHGSLAAEIVKNLALAGVGNIVIGGKESYDRLCGESSNLISYARALNSQIKVEREENVTISDRFTTAIFIDDNISSLRSWNKLCREAGVKMVGSVVRGMCGVIFDDFLDFLIEDIEGEMSRDVPIKSMISKGDQTIEISCVDEERFNDLGIGDLADIDWNTGTTKDPSNGVQIQVEDIVNIKTVRAKVLSPEVAALDLSNEGRPVLRKSKQSRMVVHKSLDDCLASPKFSPLNGCLPMKRDRASCITLLAAFIAFEQERANSGAQLSTALFRTALFRTAVLTELNEMGVEKPLRPINQGGVGADTLDAIVGRFLSSLEGVCPGVVSVVGALSAQEVIKSITHVHTPVDQIFLFESLDSLAHGGEGRKLICHDTGHQQPTSESLRCYGHELAEELAGLRIFVVGAGAIGCEILKTLALMGAATGSTLQASTVVSSEEEAQQIDEGTSDDGNLWSGLSGGGVVITDMDHIEKSNLNRQLLFRERHIGQSKAMTAVEMIKKINPRMNIRGQSTKLCPSTENVFNPAFWSQADVVLTALDNIDARRYVDEQCVKHKRWLVDSGTLGTVGSTQVVIPFVSESYSSSADPPEDMIPMCTLKSFPYQPEHCIAWSRSVFDQNFNEDVKLLRSFLELSCNGDDRALADAVSSATGDEIDRLLNAIACLDQSHDALVKWAIDLFDDIFSKQAETLIKEHPLDERDDEGIPFWGGSRRIPAVVKFDTSNIDHCQFIIWASTLRGRAMGSANEASDLRRALDDYLASPKDRKVPPTAADGNCGAIEDKSVLTEDTLKRMSLDEKRRAILNLEPQEFEKDNLSLGHIDFSTVASNLRCQVYAIRQVDRLEVQKIAGKIIPAVATTTAAVAGLVCLEVLKIAAERVRAKRMSKLQKPTLEKFGSRHKGVMATMMDAAKKWVRVDAKDSSSPPNGGERERLLLRFRNSFLNLARPLFAFSQPVEIEFFSAGGSEFSMWSTIDINRNADELTIADIESFLARRFNVQLQSVSLGDMLLYADFMPDSCGDRKISALIRATVENEATESDETVDDGRRPPTDSERVSLTSSTSFVDLNVVCINADGVDVRIPLLRVSLPSTSAVDNEGVGFDNKDKVKRPFPTFKSWFEKKKTG